MSARPQATLGSTMRMRSTQLFSFRYLLCPIASGRLSSEQRAAASMRVGKHFLPILLHIDDGPALCLRFIPCLVELADFGLPVVGVFALRIGVVHEPGKARPASRHGPLQHLQIAIGIAEGKDRPPPDEAV